MTRWVPILVVLLTAAIMWVGVAVLGDGVWSLRHTIGAIITGPSLALWALARHQLGDSFTVRASAHRLVTEGLYARIRNPIYLFGELTTLGLAIFFGWWWLMLSFVITVPMQIHRARTEAQALEAQFGDDYRAYRARTWL